MQIPCFQQRGYKRPLRPLKSIYWNQKIPTDSGWVLGGAETLSGRGVFFSVIFHQWCISPPQPRAALRWEQAGLNSGVDAVCQRPACPQLQFTACFQQPRQTGTSFADKCSPPKWAMLFKQDLLQKTQKTGQPLTILLLTFSYQVFKDKALVASISQSIRSIK